MDKREEENREVVDDADEADEEPPPATAVMAAPATDTAATSASMIAPMAIERSSAATRLPPLVASGKDCTVVLTANPILIWSGVGTVPVSWVPVAGGALPMSMKRPLLAVLLDVVAPVGVADKLGQISDPGSR